MKASDNPEQELRVTCVSQATKELIMKEMADLIANDIPAEEDQNYQRRFGFEAYAGDKSMDWYFGSLIRITLLI